MRLLAAILVLVAVAHADTSAPSPAKTDGFVDVQRPEGVIVPAGRAWCG
jgi:hypothetical protein